MGDLYEKPPPFKANASTLSARALNLMRDAIPRLITGGAGIKVSRSGGRVVIGQVAGAGNSPGTAALATIGEIKDTYLVCDKDGASIAVAKPWGIRRGVVFPTGATYVYASPSQRTKTVGGVDTVENLTPNYEVGEELLVRRLVSSRIFEDGDGPMIVWIDENTIGRYWGGVTLPDYSAATQYMKLQIPAGAPGGTPIWDYDRAT